MKYLELVRRWLEYIQAVGEALTTVSEKILKINDKFNIPKSQTSGVERDSVRTDDDNTGRDD